jgi:hypothetical protein
MREGAMIEREGSRHIGLRRPRKAGACSRAWWRGWLVLGDEQEVEASDVGRTREESEQVILIFRGEAGTVCSVGRGM